MDALTLAQEIIDGRRITREDDLNFFLTEGTLRGRRPDPQGMCGR